MQKVGGPSAQFGGGLSRQLARPLKERFRHLSELKNPVAQMLLEVVQCRLCLRWGNFFSKSSQLQRIDDFELSQSSQETVSWGSLHRLHRDWGVSVQAV